MAVKGSIAQLSQISSRLLPSHLRNCQTPASHAHTTVLKGDLPKKETGNLPTREKGDLPTRAKVTYLQRQHEQRQMQLGLCSSLTPSLGLPEANEGEFYSASAEYRYYRRLLLFQSGVFVLCIVPLGNLAPVLSARCYPLSFCKGNEQLTLIISKLTSKPTKLL